MRPLLSSDKIHKDAYLKIEQFHVDTITEIETAVKNNDWVIVGMKQNPVVKSAKKYLSDKNISFIYIEHGSYLSHWKLRLAIKLWSGWPTFPQVFHKGILVGGAADLKKYLP
ncbi:MAG: glutaredoxin [Pseudobdellovibrio sp.]